LEHKMRSDNNLKLDISILTGGTFLELPE
jgi:hypothetical protein